MTKNGVWMIDDLAEQSSIDIQWMYRATTAITMF